MAHAEKCPVCDGAGRLPAYCLERESSTLPPQTQTCYGCGGKGWVDVADDKPYIATRCPVCGKKIELGKSKGICLDCYASGSYPA